MGTVNKKMRDKLEKRKKEIKESQGGMPFFMQKEGTGRYRVLAVGAEEEPGIEIITFWLGDQKNVISPATFGMPCAIMDKYNKLSSGNEDDKTDAAKFKPKKKYAVAAGRYTDPKDGKSYDKASGIKPLLLIPGTYDGLVDLMLDEEQGDFTDPKEGYDVKIKREGTTQYDTEYKIIPCKPTKIFSEWKGFHDIEQMVKDIMPSYEETKDKIKKFLNSSGDDDKPVKKKNKTASDMDEKPKKKKKK